MRIIYIGKHGQLNSNQDEGAITHSLTELGHDVHLVQEHKLIPYAYKKCDIVLFNHCKDFDNLQQIDAPKVFWCFDRIYWDGLGLEGRNLSRMEWVKEATKISKVGFLTDGDWVANDKSGKLVWLTQGFNQYLPSVPPSEKDSGTILFTGGGKYYGRDSFVAEMKERYGSKFIHVVRGLHGHALAQVIANVSIVVAPDSPVTDRYWSNRVYLTLGLGGFLLHPYTDGLYNEYGAAVDGIMYQSRATMHDLIDAYLSTSKVKEIRQSYLKDYTLNQHTYKHRCQKLIEIVKERLSL